MASKIYTKTGDKGMTSLFGGTRLYKDDIRIEAYGTIDELNAFAGLLIEELPHIEGVKPLLRQTQNTLFDIGSQLAVSPGKEEKYALSGAGEEDIRKLETAMDEMNLELPELKHFILPGGNRAAAICHICRTVCRRAERRIIRLERSGATTDPLSVKYLNRLSDYFFVLARYIVHRLEDDEILWGDGV